MSPEAQPQVVLITGATGAAGRATAARFAAAGARLALVSRDRPALEEIGRSLGVPDDRWLAVAGELTDADAARKVAGAVTAKWGRIDVLLHLVGGWVGGTAVVDLDPDEVRGMLDQHLWTTLYIVQAVVPGMVERGFGRVLAVSSPFAADVRAKGASYAIGKAAEEVLLRSLAREAGTSGVTANVLLVRSIDAELKNASSTTPDEIAEALFYLASPAAGAISGARIPLDGRAC